jgi:hypothetical protein
VNHDETHQLQFNLFFFIIILLAAGPTFSNNAQSSLMILLLSILLSDRLFKIRLRRNADVFADDVVLESSKGSIAFDMDKVYQGELEGILESRSHFLPSFHY